MNVRADSAFWPQSSPSQASRDTLVGVADRTLRILLADDRLACLLGVEATSLAQRDLLELIPDETSRALLLLAVQGVAPEVQLPPIATGAALLARGARAGADRTLLLYERSAAEATLGRSSHVRTRHFVGREAEKASFDGFLASDEPSVLFVQGPHGIGKTALLAAFEARCLELDCAYVKVDAASSPMCEGAIVDALAAGSGLQQSDLARIFATARVCARKWVLFIDNFDAWILKARVAFREIFEMLPPEVRIVIAGRRPPEQRWWSGGSRDAVLLSLCALDRACSEALLDIHGSRPEARDEILSRAKGHPLCLVTLGKVSCMPGEPFDAYDHVVDLSLDSKLPLPLLEVAALPARLTEDVLAELIGEGAAPHEAYDVLSTICLRDPSGVGVRFPWFLRTAIALKLRGRSPERFAALRAKLASFYAQRLDRPTSSACLLPVVDDALEAFSDLPLLKMLVGESTAADARRAGACDLEAVTAAARRLGGEGPAALVERRMQLGLEQQATYVTTGDGAIGGIVQFSVTSMEEASQGARDRADAPLASAVEALRGLTGLTARDPVAICTAWLTSDLARDEWGPTSRALALLLLRKVLAANPRVMATAFVLPPGEAKVRLLLIPGAQIIRDGTHTVVLRDLRGFSPGAALLALLERGDTLEGLVALEGLGTSAVPQRTLISAETVRSALMHLDSPERLAASPLAACPLVIAASRPDASTADRAAMLARLLRGSIHALAGSPRDVKAREVLDAVFLGGGGKHEQIAREIGVPYGTFRRRLAHGIERITEALRERDRDSFLEAAR